MNLISPKHKSVHYKSINNEEKSLKIIKELSNKKDYEDEIEEEFNQFVDYIINIEKRSAICFEGKNQISFQDMIISLINLADPTNSTISEDMAIIVLKVFRKIIESVVPEIKKSPVEWESDDYNHKEAEVRKKQNQLVKLGIVKLLYQLISTEKSSLVCLFKNII